MKTEQFKQAAFTLKYAGLLIVAFLLAGCGKPGIKEYTVLRGPFIQSVTESGELEARNAAAIILPRINYRYGYNFKIIGLRDHGSIVHAGDSVVGLDPSSVYKFIISREESLEKERAKAEKQKVQSENALRELEVQLKNETAVWELKKLELERLQFESEMKKKVKELEFRQATIRLEKIKRNLQLKPVIENFDKIINRMAIKQREEDIQGAKETLDKLVLYSPGNGLFQVGVNRRTNQNYKLGDEVWMGSMVASIPDISVMKVKSYVSETDVSKVDAGMKVIVRLDALPNVSFRGVVSRISKICTEEENEKIFATEIDILDTDQRLKPGMSVSCEYVCFETDEAVFVPNKCLLKDGNHAWAFVKKGRGSLKVDVEAGPSNANYTIIKGELKPGRKLVPVEQI
ncbi:MAG TPA: efflux RND transporter periplasmic adaptor subunit [Bacteroidales bacterium]|nr:efflux RND transporter periplasmic adaptor subunit [Bacteroidales bacterium]